MPDPEYEVPSIDWIIEVFPINKNDDGKPELIINSWANPFGALKDLLKNRLDLKWSLVFCTYRWPNGLK